MSQPIGEGKPLWVVDEATLERAQALPYVVVVAFLSASSLSYAGTLEGISCFADSHKDCIVVIVDLDDPRAFGLHTTYGITQIPTFRFFNNGEQFSESVGTDISNFDSIIGKAP